MKSFSGLKILVLVKQMKKNAKVTPSFSGLKILVLVKRLKG